MTLPSRLDEKLARIRAGEDEFILCDARDPDMARGIGALGVVRLSGGARRPSTRREFLDAVRAEIAQDVIDLMLLSPLNLHRLTAVEDAFAGSRIGRAARVNDTSEIWLGRHMAYRQSPSRPFRNADLARVMDRQADGSLRGADLGLYSVTFVNQVEADLSTLEAYRAFRAEADALGFRHFLEVFNPNHGKFTPEETGAYVNDMIVRMLAGIDRDAAPVFLKVAFNGKPALSELIRYDDEMIVGVLGGAAGTTRDTFELLAQARDCGARLALFGRKIAQAEDPLELIRLLRALADGGPTPEEAVVAYHDHLEAAGLAADRPLAADLRITDPILLAGA